MDDRRSRFGGAGSGELPLGRERDAADAGTAVAGGFADEEDRRAGSVVQVVGKAFEEVRRGGVLVERLADAGGCQAGRECHPAPTFRRTPDTEMLQPRSDTVAMRAFWRRWLGQARQAGLDKPSTTFAQYNIYDARNLFSHLVRRVQKGEEIVIARAGDPIVRLVPYREELPRRPGALRLSLIVNDALDAPLGAERVTPTRSSPAASTSRQEPPGSPPESR
jgi:prevent-host-death family protein